MLEFRKYIPEDYLRINRRYFDMLTFQNFPSPRATGEHLAKGPAYTGLADGEIVACGGILPLWKGVGEAWVISSELVPKYPLFFHRTISWMLDHLIEKMKLVRVQTTVHSKHERSIKWVERMGFVNEGLMRKYIAGEDYIRFARVED